MTICAAALCRARPIQEGAPSVDFVLGISDRMITTDDVEYEAAHASKSWVLSQKVICLGAGNSLVHHTALTKTHRDVMHGKVMDVEETARVYGQSLMAFKRERVGNFLSSVVEDVPAFLEAQQRSNPELVIGLANKQEDERLGVGVIVAGWDISGAHLYHVGENGVPICFDGIGFVAIGSGSRPFETEFMLARYDRFWWFETALLLMYSAKRQAEISPGVGKETDMFLVGPERWAPIEQPTMTILKEYYEEFEKTVKDKRTEIFKRMADDERFKPAKQEPKKQESSHAASDQKGISGSAGESKPETPSKEAGEVKSPEEKPSSPSEPQSSEPPSESGQGNA